MIAADISDFQATVMNLWPDGSIKFAVLAGRIDLQPSTPQTITLNAVPASAAASALTTTGLVATGITASIDFSPYGTVTWAGTDWANPQQTWISGPMMSSWTYRKPIGTDPHLVAWLEVRLFDGGNVEILPWIENGYLNVAGPGEKSGTATFTLGGNQAFSQPLDLLNYQRAILASGTTLSYWLRADPGITPAHDTAYLQSTRLVPAYMGVTSASSPLWSNLVTSYTPLAQANYSPDMSQTGYQPAIGLLPIWDAAYLTGNADARAWQSVQVNAYCAGRYGIHFRDETTNRPLRFSSYPNLVVSGSAGITSTGASSTRTYTPTASGTKPPNYNSAHHPSMGYFAYLLTGRLYFLEECQFLATTNFLKNTDTSRQYSNGIFMSNAGANTTRGAAWAIRTLAQAASITPDADPLHAEFVSSVNANITYNYQTCVAGALNDLGLVPPYSNYNGTASPWTSSVWMDDFYTASFGYLRDLQVHDPALDENLDAFLAWKYRSIVGRLGGSGTDQYSYRYAAQYTVPYGPSGTGDMSSNAGPWYTSWGAVARAMGLATDGDAGLSLTGSSGANPAGMATGYWGNLMPALAYAVDHGATGAKDAYIRLTSASNWSSSAATFNDTPLWGVRPRTL
jgi:hypothetical protein